MFVAEKPRNPGISRLSWALIVSIAPFPQVPSREFSETNLPTA